MDRAGDSLVTRIASLGRRARALGSLRATLRLPRHADLSERQWHLIDNSLVTLRVGIESRLAAARAALGTRSPVEVNASLGDAELELSRAYNVFDTYMDVLSQRLAPPVGRALAGCDVLAHGALSRDQAALRMAAPPVTHFDRGFGASILREGVRLQAGLTNALPLVQLPYARTLQKLHLSSLFHEVGHEAMSRLGLVQVWPVALDRALALRGFGREVRELWGRWIFEVAPDFWSFCCAGTGHAAALPEILALPPEHVFRVVGVDPHPPPFLRVLQSFDFCRSVWGRGPWEDWEAGWRALYPLRRASPVTRRLVEAAARAIPTVTETLMRTRLRALGGRAVRDLFDLQALAPATVERRAERARRTGRVDLRGLEPVAHLAVFRALERRGVAGAAQVERMMTGWLGALAERRGRAPAAGQCSGSNSA